VANAAGAAPGGHRNGFWGVLSLPGVAWLMALFVVPFYAVAAVAFGRVDPILRTADPVWSPLSWNFSAMGNVLDRVFDPNDLGAVVIRTLAYVGSALALCCLVGYPVAYYVARHASRWRGVLLAALVLPFWISYLMRMLAWVNLLQVDGYFNRLLGWMHLGGSRNWLDGDWPTVVIGLAYGYIPFFILPLYAALERLDKRLIEAGRDLGASPARVFQRVTLPLSVPGLMAASVITVLPMFGDYYTNSFLTSGSPRTEMLGNQIEFYLRGTSQPQTGASLVLILSAMLLVLMTYYLVVTVRAQRAVAT
jgi:spermidine/putrescine transport system permease protein